MEHASALSPHFRRILDAFDEAIEADGGSLVIHDEHGTFALRDAEVTATGAVGWID